MADWNTRLAVSYEEGGKTVQITPIDSFSPAFSLNAEVLDSIEEPGVGVIYNPPKLSFSLSVKAIGDVSGQLTALALQGKRFNVILQEADGGDWSFNSLVLSDCLITSATPTAATPSGAPTATFSGFSLAARAEPKVGSPVEVP